MPKRDRKTYASEFVHGKRRPPPTPSTHPHLAPRPTGPQLEVTTTSIASSLAREDQRTKGRYGAEAAPRVSAGQLDDLKQSSRLLEQSKSNEKT